MGVIKKGASLLSQGQAFRASANAPFLRKLRNASGGSPILSPKIFGLILAFFLIVLIFFLTLRFSPYPALADFKNRSVSTRIYDSQGKLIQITALEDGVRREFLPLSEIPPFAQECFIEAEDRHFYSHHGIDFAAIARAAFQNVSEARTVSGASTITMQLARIIRPNPKRTLFVKTREAFDALCLETRLSKSEILELYLNSVPFGFNTEGIASAARYFFSKEVKDLSETQAACLAVIPRRPSLYNPLTNPENCAKAAFELLQNQANKARTDTIEDFEKASRSARPFSYPFYAPHFLRYLSQMENSPIGKQAEIRTTLDLDLQHYAENMLSRAVEQYAENRLSNGAILVTDTESGAIRAWVGSADFFNDAHNGQVDGVLSTQQPGSSMKPFLYALAIESGVSPATVLPDIPMEFGFENLYVPQNFNNRFNGPVRFRVALASSLNIPAVYLLNEIGIENYLKKLRELGFISLEHADAGLSLALGGADVSIFEMTQAFSVFARDGLFLPLYAIEDEKMKNHAEFAEFVPTSSARIFDMNTARLICDMLSDKDARALGFGYSQTFVTPFPAMFKTGTANQYQNITALGATPHYTVGVWMGNFSGETVVGKTGSSIPAKIARDLLISLQGTSGKDFQKPAQFKKERICALSGMRASAHCPDTVTEYLPMRESAPRETCTWHSESGTVYPSEYATWFRLKNRSGEVGDRGSELKIISPRSGSVFYYDESIPRGQQKLIVEASGGSEESARFFVDGSVIEEKERPFVAQIPLTRGTHRITVESGEERAEITIEVK